MDSALGAAVAVAVADEEYIVVFEGYPGKLDKEVAVGDNLGGSGHVLVDVEHILAGTVCRLARRAMVAFGMERRMDFAEAVGEVSDGQVDRLALRATEQPSCREVEARLYEAIQETGRPWRWAFLDSAWRLEQARDDDMAEHREIDDRRAEMGGTEPGVEQEIACAAMQHDEEEEAWPDLEKHREGAVRALFQRAVEEE